MSQKIAWREKVLLIFLERFNARDIVEGCLWRTVYKKFTEDIGDNDSTSVEFALEICSVELRCGHTLSM